MRTLLDFATRVTIDARDPGEMARWRDAQVEALRRMLREAQEVADARRSDNKYGTRP